MQELTLHIAATTPAGGNMVKACLWLMTLSEQVICDNSNGDLRCDPHDCHKRSGGPGAMERPGYSW